MPLEVIQPKSSAPIGARLIPPSRGWAEVHPAFRESFSAARLMTAESLLSIPGEIVCGHPDRHVRQVRLPDGRIGYLKRQHRVGWRERLKQWLAGFGWSPRSIREAKMLRELDRAKFPCPQWIAFGEDGDGRAFLLVEEVAGSRDLRATLSDSGLSLRDRRRVAEWIGQAIAELHAAGFSTPDLSAKHILVDSATFAVTLIDWQNASRGAPVARSLASLDASLANALASPRERLRAAWAYARVCRKSGLTIPKFSELIRGMGSESERLSGRRSLRDQREAVVTDQRLVWVADEAVCAIPDIAAIWPKPAIAPPFYSCKPGTIRIQLADGRTATLIRGRSFTPLPRLLAAVKGKPWRSPASGIARELFQKQRYGEPAPQLYAFGHRITGLASAEWFVLHADEKS